MTLEQRKQVYIDYMKMKMEEQDWHGVSDAANDLRELDVEISLRKRVAAKTISNSINEVVEWNSSESGAV